MLISCKCIFQSPAGFFRDKLTASVSGTGWVLRSGWKMCDVILIIAWQVLLKSFEIMCLWFISIYPLLTVVTNRPHILSFTKYCSTYGLIFLCEDVALPHKCFLRYRYLEMATIFLLAEDGRDRSSFKGILFQTTQSILTPQVTGYFEDLYTPASYRFIHPSIARPNDP